MSYRHTEDVLLGLKVPLAVTSPNGEPAMRERMRTRNGVKKLESSQVVLGDKHKLALLAYCFWSNPDGLAAAGHKRVARAAACSPDHVKILRQDLESAGILILRGVAHYKGGRLQVKEGATRFGRGEFPAYIINTDRLMALLDLEPDEEKWVAQGTLFPEKRVAQATSLTEVKREAQATPLSIDEDLSEWPNGEKRVANAPKASGPGHPQYIIPNKKGAGANGAPLSLAEFADMVEGKRGPGSAERVRRCQLLGGELVATNEVVANRLREDLGVRWLHEVGVTIVVANDDAIAAARAARRDGRAAQG